MQPLFGLLQACKDEPDQDDPRLILADWLEQHGDEAGHDRSEFVRLGCARARLPDQHADEARLLARLYQLVLRNEHRWLGPILDRVEPYRIYFRRGLVEVETEPNGFLKGVPSSPATDPVFAWVSGLRLRGSARDRPDQLAVLRDPRLAAFSFVFVDDHSWEEQDWQALTDSGSPPRLPSVRVVSQPGEAFGRALARCPLFEGARFLDLRHADRSLDDDALNALARAPWLARVTHLSLSGNRVGYEGVRVLRSSPNLGQLQHLNLECNPIGDEGAVALAQCPRLAALTHLDLRRTGVTPWGVKALAASPHLRKLQWLDLSENQIGDAGAGLLAASPNLAAVHTLNLAGCSLKGDGVSALARSPHTGALRELALGSCPLDEEVASELTRSSSLTGLRRLSLGGARVEAGALAALGSGTALARLDTLNLGFARVGPEELRALGQAPGLPALTSLALHPDETGPALGEVLAGSRLFRQLRRLWLWPPDGFEADGIEGLCRLLDEGNLEDLHLPCCPLREKALKRLADCPGLGRLVRLDLGQVKGIGLRGLQALVGSPHLSRLAILDLSHCNLRTIIKGLAGMRLEGLAVLDLNHNDIDETGAEVVRGIRQERPDVYLKVLHNNFHGRYEMERRWTLEDRDGD
jgi:uncharacterized protein (TIGR02996 family)